MTHLEIKRIACDGERPTLGVLLNNGRPFALTLERPWLGNRTSESCIPIGDYLCLRCSKSPDYSHKNSPKFGDTFQVYEVPNRSNILFHKGNVNEDTHGCIIVGEQFDFLNGDEAVLASSQGFNEFQAILMREGEFTLSITDHFSDK